MANFCSHCGAASRPGANFCENCGARLTPEAAVPEQDNPYRRGNIGPENFGPGENGGREGANGAGYTVNAGSAYDPFPESGLIQQLFSTRGRLNRWRYFKRRLAIFGLILLVPVVCYVLTTLGYKVKGVPELILLCVLTGAAASICLVIRRFRDMEPVGNTDNNFVAKRMGAYVGCMLLGGIGDLMGILSLLVELYLLFNPGVPGANRHGADPLAG